MVGMGLKLCIVYTKKRGLDWMGLAFRAMLYYYGTLYEYLYMIHSPDVFYTNVAKNVTKNLLYGLGVVGGLLLFFHVHPSALDRKV